MRSIQLNADLDDALSTLANPLLGTPPPINLRA
jgi:hypothetical protein